MTLESEFFQPRLAFSPAHPMPFFTAVRNSCDEADETPQHFDDESG
jgi:hypothetical protein